MKIKDIKKENRPVEKMIKLGPNSLSNEELLAILINTGTKNKSSIEIAYEIINSKEKLEDLLNLTLIELTKFSGIKMTKASRIAASFELTKRLMYSSGINHKLISHEDSIRLLYPIMSHKQTEEIMVLALDSKCNLINKINFTGDIAQSFIPINEIIKFSILNSARGIIISHNHPSGDPTPSKNDIIVTQKLNNQLNEFNLLLFDHIIIGKNKYYSFNENDYFCIIK